MWNSIARVREVNEVSGAVFIFISLVKETHSVAKFKRELLEHLPTICPVAPRTTQTYLTFSSIQTSLLLISVSAVLVYLIDISHFGFVQ